jgi:isopentenyldiphosphate isomerase
VEAFTPARMLRIHFDSQGHSHAQYLAIETSSVFVERLAKECKTLGSLWTKACCGENNINNRVVCRLLLLKLLTIASAVDS